MSPGFWSTNNTLHICFSCCFFNVCSSSTNFLLEKEKVATIDGAHLSSDLGDLGGCNAKDGFCKMQDGCVIWNPDKMDWVCKFKKDGIYNSSTTMTHVIVDKIQGAFSWPRPAIVVQQEMRLPCGAGITVQGAAIMYIHPVINSSLRLV